MKYNKEHFGNSVFKTGLVTFIFYTIFSVVVLIYSFHLIIYMNPNETDLLLVNSYLSISTIAFMIGIIVSFVNVVFVVIGKSKNVYIFLATKAVVTIISDFIIIPQFGVIGVAASKILINALLAIVGIVILFIEKLVEIAWFKKKTLKYLKSGVILEYFLVFNNLSLILFMH